MRGTRGIPALLLALVASTAAPVATPAASAGDPPDGNPSASAPARTPEFQRRVDEAIARGALWVRGQQRKGGGFAWLGGFMGGAGGAAPTTAAWEFGTTSLAVLTLRSCGVPPDDAAVKSGLARMRTLWKANQGRATYEVSLALLALEAHYAAPETAPGAGDRPGAAPAGERRIPSADLDWIRDLARWLSAGQFPAGGFGYYSPASGRPDLSNSQYALLGLKAARRCGVEVRKEIFRRAAEFHLSCQERSGPKVTRAEGTGAGEEAAGKGRSRAAVVDEARGFGYQDAGSPTGSMTAAGVSSLVICRGEIRGTSHASEKSDATLVRAVRDGIAWLGRNFSVTANPASHGGAVPTWHFYYLYGLERAGVLSGVAWMGRHDWYGEGAEFLVGGQLSGGGWDAPGGRSGRGAGRGDAAKAGDLLDTCFALLFLKKATFRVEGAVATEEADDRLDLTGAESLDDDTYRAVFDSVFGRFLRGAERRGDLSADFVRLGTRAIPLLIRLLEDEDAGRRDAAIEALRRVTGVTHGYAADAPADARGVAVAAWEEWWFSRRAGLVPDAGAGRFREGPAPK